MKFKGDTKMKIVKLLTLSFLFLNVYACNSVNTSSFSIDSSSIIFSDKTSIESDIYQYNTVAIIGENSQGSVVVSIYKNQFLLKEFTYSNYLSLSQVLSVKCLIINGIKNTSINANLDKEEIKKIVITNSNKALINLKSGLVINPGSQELLITTDSIYQIYF
jgi:hypothetical protein